MLGHVLIHVVLPIFAMHLACMCLPIAPVHGSVSVGSIHAVVASGDVHHVVSL